MKHPEIFVVLDNIRSALNVGAIFRTSDAARVESLILCGITAYPPHNRIPKTALGSIESVNWEYFNQSAEALNKLRKNKVEIVSIELTENAVDFWDYEFKKRTALVFGNEISGISKSVIEESDAIVKIPMFGKKESLNVATSVGIVLYEVIRQTRVN